MSGAQSLYVIRVLVGKAAAPILVFLETVTVFRFLHRVNAYSPIEATLSGMVTLVRPLHPSNALSAIEVMFVGMVMFVMLVHPQNAPFPIVVTPSGIVTFSALPL